MESFKNLLDVVELVHARCPWSKKQTFDSLCRYVIEEAYEVVEAAQTQDDMELASELGDLLYTVLFYAKIAEKEGKFSFETILELLSQKIIRRNPLVFDSDQELTEELVVETWKQIKKQEASSPNHRLPVLIKVQKIAEMSETDLPEMSESEIGEQIFNLIVRARKSGFDLEHILKQMC